MGGQLLAPAPNFAAALICTPAEPETRHDKEESKTERGERTAENVRYGQNISEGGMGGKTTEAGGSANQGSRHAVCRFAEN